MKRLLGLALVVSMFLLGGCVYGPGYYQRPAVVYDDGSAPNNAPVDAGDYGYGYGYDDGYYAPGYYGGGYSPWCCYGGWYPWLGVGFYGGYYHGYHGWHGGGGWHGSGGWHGGGGHSGGSVHGGGHH